MKVYSITSQHFMKNKAFTDLFLNKWKEEKGYCSKFNRLPMYKNAVNVFKEKVNRTTTLSISSTKRNLKSKPQTSNTHHSKLRTSRFGFKSYGFKFSKKNFVRERNNNKSFLEIKSKELHRPIHKEDYENIYAVSTTNFFENLVENDDINFDLNDENQNEVDNIGIDNRIQILSNNQDDNVENQSPDKISLDNQVQIEKLKSKYINEEIQEDNSLEENILSNQRLHDLLHVKSCEQANESGNTKKNSKDEFKTSPAQEEGKDGKVMSSEMFNKLIKINKLNAYNIIKNKLEVERMKYIEANNKNSHFKQIEGEGVNEKNCEYGEDAFLFGQKFKSHESNYIRKTKMVKKNLDSNSEVIIDKEVNGLKITNKKSPNNLKSSINSRKGSAKCRRKFSKFSSINERK